MHLLFEEETLVGKDLDEKVKDIDQARAMSNKLLANKLFANKKSLLPNKWKLPGQQRQRAEQPSPPAEQEAQTPHPSSWGG